MGMRNQTWSPSGSSSVPTRGYRWARGWARAGSGSSRRRASPRASPRFVDIRRGGRRRMLAETPAERGRRLVDGHDDGHDDLDDADDDDDHDDDHDGSARRVDRITRPRRSRASSVCGRSGTPPAVRNAAAGPSTRWCRTARRGSHPRQRRERYCSRVREPRLAFGSLRLHARGSRRRVLPLYRCVPAVVSPGIRVAEPVLGRQRVGCLGAAGDLDLSGQSSGEEGSRHVQECSAERLPRRGARRVPRAARPKPRTIERSLESPLVSARIAVNLAAPSVPREQRNVLSPNG